MDWPTVYSGPAKEPLTLQDVKDHLRLDGNDEAMWLRGAIVAARRQAEEYTGRALITQTLDLTLQGFPAGNLVLPRPPLASVTSIAYTKRDGTTATVSSADYLVDTKREPGRVVLKDGKSWPSDTLREVNGVVVRYVAGYGADPEDVPEEIRLWMLVTIGTMYENREATAQSGMVSPLAFADGLLANYRLYWRE